MKSCLGLIVIVVLLYFIVKIAGCVIDTTKEKANQLSNWRDERLAEKARKADEEKAKIEAEKRIAEQKRQQAEALAAAKQREESKVDKIRTFALKEAPKMWEVFQALQSEIDNQGAKIEDLRKTLVSFGKDPIIDEDYRRICDLRDDMIRSRKILRKKLEDAYITWRKYEASPSRKDYQELHKKAIENGIQEAEATSAKFKEMRLSK